jgi:hypothetical protein
MKGGTEPPSFHVFVLREDFATKSTRTKTRGTLKRENFAGVVTTVRSGARPFQLHVASSTTSGRWTSIHVTVDEVTATITERLHHRNMDRATSCKVHAG